MSHDDPLPPPPSDPPDPAFEDVLAEYLAALDARGAEAGEEVIARHPAHESELRRFAADSSRMDRLAEISDAAARAVHRQSASSGEDSSATRAFGRTDDSPLLDSGTRVGSYVVRSVLGRGGMGTVYSAVHSRLEREVALKILAPGFAHDPERVHRFEREGRALATLVHPNVVAVFDMGVDGERYFIAMEQVDGENLRERLARGPLSAAHALRITRDLCSALDYAHSRGVVHRDIKPENILLAADGTPKIADFGLARMVDGDPHDFRTRNQMLIGTRRYMAPEQWLGGEVDHRADLYALGIVLVEMLTDHAPGPGDEPLSEPVRRVVEKALREDPAARYQSAHELIEDLERRSAEAKRVAARPAAAVPVVDLTTGETLFEVPEAWIRIRVARWALDGSLGIELRGSPRPQLEFALPRGGYRVTPLRRADDQGVGEVAGVDVRLDGWRGTFHLPVGCRVEVVSENAEVRASHLDGTLDVHPGSGDLLVESHRGRLHATRHDRGAIVVQGLESDDVDLGTALGRIYVRGLVLASGKARLRSGRGSLECGLDVERSSVRYVARAPERSVSVSGVPADPDTVAPRVEGVLREGFAELELESDRGEVLLQDDASLADARHPGKLARLALCYWPAIAMFGVFFLLLYTRVPFVGRTAAGPLLAVGTAYVLTYLLFRLLCRIS